MRYDDRLTTVLGSAAADRRGRAVQWRQLVELLARGAAADNPRLRDQVLSRIAAFMREVPDEVRAAAARAIAGPDLPAELVALFAAEQLEIAAPVVTAAELDSAGWAALRAVASPGVLSMLAALQPGPEPKGKPPAASQTGEPPAEPPGVEIASPPPLVTKPTTPPPGLFRWECGPSGEIDWVEGAPRGALIGRSLADDLDRRFAVRLPFEDEPLEIASEGALAGVWRWTGTPAFLPDTGQFAGYHGIARREGSAIEAGAGPAVPLDSDSLRELVHELKTPLNAIIGFGEIIGGQYLGPAHGIYRERAARIVEQGRQLLQAVQDLDLTARLHSGRGQPDEVRSFAALFAPVRRALLEQAAASGVTLTFNLCAGVEDWQVQRDLADRLLRRFLHSVLAAAGAREHLELVVDRTDRFLSVSIRRPSLACDMREASLLDGRTEGSDPVRSLRFALGLVRNLARLTGGDLEFAPERFVLLLPPAQS